MTNYSREEYKSGQHALDEKQVRALLLSFDAIQDKAMIALAITLGLRREDLVNCKRKDYDPASRKLTYCEHKKRRTRTLKIPSLETVQLLNMHIKTCRNSPWLFPSPKQTGRYKNAHVSSRHIYDIYNEHLDVIGVDRRPFHSLRATCYKLAQSKGWTVRKAAGLAYNGLQTL